MCISSTLETVAMPALPDPMRPDIWRVASNRRETRDTFTLTLHPESVEGLTFQPGQFNMLYLFGVGEVPISISGDPADDAGLVHTVRAVGAVTAGMMSVRRGDVLGVRGPFGTAWPVREARGRDVVIVAGGIGLAPLRPALYHVLNHRGEYGRVVLCYGARSPEDLLYARELERWRGRFDLEVEIAVDAAAEGWRGNVGVVTTLLDQAHFDPADAVAMVVGPEIMMRFSVLALKKLGMEEDEIYISMERNMRCGIGQCGHCQFGPSLICRDGPVYRYDQVSNLLAIREV